MTGRLATASWTASALALGFAGSGCEQRRVDVGGYKLWTEVSGRGSPAVVFESGGGDSSAVWEKLAPEVRQRCAVQTVRYDRAGLGKSDLAPGPYRIDNEASALERVLDVRDVRGPVVLVAHSYGGFVATLVAASDARVARVVLVDANLSGFFDDAEVARLLAKYSPQWLIERHGFLTPTQARKNFEEASQAA
jgi:pimeloyl-ACP methyl ester carboxylesterase